MKNETCSDKSALAQFRGSLPLALRRWLATVFILAISALTIGGVAAWGEAMTPRPQVGPVVLIHVGGGYEVWGPILKDPALMRIDEWTAPSDSWEYSGEYVPFVNASMGNIRSNERRVIIDVDAESSCRVGADGG